VLVVTFKPAVEDAWQNDLESHVDFDGWQYLSKRSDMTPDQIKNNRPLVYFGSFQDLLGRDDVGNIKAKNTWVHALNWDLVIFDEYHFGAWRDTAKELFEAYMNIRNWRCKRSVVTFGEIPIKSNLQRIGVNFQPLISYKELESNLILKAISCLKIFLLLPRNEMTLMNTSIVRNIKCSNTLHLELFSRKLLDE
jgi:hypothetical protein